VQKKQHFFFEKKEAKNFCKLGGAPGQRCVADTPRRFVHPR
jgi:hypothetical protein